METFYLRDKKGFPGACLAIAERGYEGLIVFAVAAWNSKKDAEAFKRHASRVLAEIRAEKSRLRLLDPSDPCSPFVIFANKHADGKYEKDPLVGMQIPDPGKGGRLHAALRKLAETPEFPQRARDAAKRHLEWWEAREARLKMRVPQEEPVEVEA